MPWLKLEYLSLNHRHQSDQTHMQHVSVQVSEAILHSINTFTIVAMSPSSKMRTALRSPLAKASMAPMWAMNRSSGSVDSLRTLASKLRPPGCRPPCSTMVCRGFDRRDERGGIIQTHSVQQWSKAFISKSIFWMISQGLLMQKYDCCLCQLGWLGLFIYLNQCHWSQSQPTVQRQEIHLFIDLLFNFFSFHIFGLSLSCYNYSISFNDVSTWIKK